MVVPIVVRFTPYADTSGFYLDPDVRLVDGYILELQDKSERTESGD